MKIVYFMLCVFVLAVDCANEAQCQLPSHPSVEYRCFFSDPVIFDGVSSGAFRACREFEPAGTVVSPHCRTPDYFSTTALAHMRCKSGKWDYIAKCIPECGIVTPDGTQLVLGGESAKQAEVPWHAGIYTKTSIPYKQLCGGTLISNKIVISAAHCFWDSQQGTLLPSDSFAVAIGKLYRPWDNKMDKAQHSDVKEVHIPDHFQGSSSYFQADIALVVVTTPFEFNRFVRPVCIDFDNTFEKIQLQPGKRGKVAGWGLTTENGTESQVLKVIELPYISTGECISESPYSFRPYITTDKFCAGYKNAGKALCKGDSGGGLAFPELGRGKERHYLRGVVSAAPNEDLNKCNANAFTSFTKLLIHEHFVKEFWVAEGQLVSDTRPIEDDDRIKQQAGGCVLPPYPDHGTYVVVNAPNAKPGDRLNTVILKVICDKGYRLSSSSSGVCFNGTWQGQLPKCVVLPCTDASLNSSVYYFTPTYSMDDVSLNHYVTLNRNSIGHLLHFEMHFAVQTDGYVVLKLSEEESYLNSNIRYKLFIGWDSHQRYVLYYNEKIVYYAFNMDILSAIEFRQFYIKIGNGTLEFGKEGTPIKSYPGDDLGSLTYYRIEVYDSQSAKLRYCPAAAAAEESQCKEGSLSASHLVYSRRYSLEEKLINLYVRPKADSKSHYAHFEIHFAVQTRGYMTITLSEKGSYDHSNIRCALRIGVDGNRRTTLEFNGETVHYIDTPKILSSTQFRNFYIKMDDGTLTFGKEGETPLISYTYTWFSAFQYYRFELYSLSSQLRFCPVAAEGLS